MNLEDVIDPEYGLQQDEWSLSKPKFDEEGQLEVIGWSGRQKTNNARFYLLFAVYVLKIESYTAMGILR